jgi:hypothetical protein
MTGSALTQRSTRKSARARVTGDAASPSDTSSRLMRQCAARAGSAPHPLRPRLRRTWGSSQPTLSQGAARPEATPFPQRSLAARPEHRSGRVESARSQQRLGVRVLGGGEHPRCRTPFDDLPEVEHDDVIGDRLNGLEVMRDVDHRDLQAVPEVGEQREHLAPSPTCPTPRSARPGRSGPARPRAPARSRRAGAGHR